MEPFSLFHFLQNFLNSPAAEPPKTEEPAPFSESNTEQSQDALTDVPTSTSSQDAVLQFLSAHETRVKRTRK